MASTDYLEDGVTEMQRIYQAGQTKPADPAPGSGRPKAAIRADSFVTNWLRANDGVLGTLKASYSPPAGELTIPLAGSPSSAAPAPAASLSSSASQWDDLGPGDAAAIYRRLDVSTLTPEQQQEAQRLLAVIEGD